MILGLYRVLVLREYFFYYIFCINIVYRKLLKNMVDAEKPKSRLN